MPVDEKTSFVQQQVGNDEHEFPSGILNSRAFVRVVGFALIVLVLQR